MSYEEIAMSVTLGLLIKEDFLQIGADFLNAIKSNPSSVNVAAQSLLAVNQIVILPTEVVAQAQPLVSSFFSLAADHLNQALAQTQAQIAAAPAPAATTAPAAAPATPAA